jgi:hypothetical protein
MNASQEQVPVRDTCSRKEKPVILTAASKGCKGRNRFRIKPVWQYNRFFQSLHPRACVRMTAVKSVILKDTPEGKPVKNLTSSKTKITECFAFTECSAFLGYSLLQHPRV